MPVWMRAVVLSSCRSIHCSTKNTKMALKTTCSDAVFETACVDATMPARTQTKEPKYQAGAGGALAGGRRVRSRNTAAIRKTQIAQVEGTPHPVVQQRQEHEADVDETARHDHEEVVPRPRPHSTHETETATGSFAYGDTDIG